MDIRPYITTIDNPYNPCTEYDAWYQFDTINGYYSDSRVARLYDYKFDDLEIEKELDYEKAIDELIKIDILDIYKKIYIDITTGEIINID